MNQLVMPLLLFGFLQVHLSACQKEAATEVEAYIENLWTKIDVTLNDWQIATGLEDQSKQKIRDSMADTVDRVAQSYRGREEGGYLKRIPKDVEEQLELSLREIAGVEFLETLRRDQELVKKFNRQTAITSVVARLDLGLALNGKQIDQLTECLDEKWDATQHKYSSPAFSRTLPHGDFPDQAISEILLPVQYEYWVRNRQKPAAGEEITFHFAADDPKRMEKFQPKLDAAIELRVQVLKQQFDLNENQVRKLNLLVKRHRNKLIELRRTAYLDVQMVRDMGRSPMDSPLSGRATMTASALLGSEGSWTEFVRKTLTGSDRDTYERLTAKREMLHHSANVYNLTRIYQRWAGLCGRQMFEFYDTCFDNIPIDANWIRGDRGMYLAVEELPGTGIHGIITERQAGRLRFWSNNLKALHQLIENERKKKAAKAEEDSNSE